MVGVVTLHVDRAPGRLIYRMFGPDGPIGNTAELSLSDFALGEALGRAHSLLRRPEAPSFRDEAVAVGKWLYGNLLPETIKSDISAVCGSLVVSTNIHGYPFELFHDGEEFLGIRLAVSRSVDSPIPTDRGRPRPDFENLHVLVIGSNPRGDLPLASPEAELVAQSLGSVSTRKVDVRVGQVNKPDVLRLLQEGVQLLHYCGHIEHRSDGSIGLLLANGEIVTSNELGNLRPAPWFVFLNACGSARTAQKVDLQHWEEDLSSIVGGFIRAGARAAIGTLSEVSDSQATELAKTFYYHVTKGISFAESLRLARKESRDVAPDSSTFLSFILYGPPTSIPTGPTTSTLEATSHRPTDRKAGRRARILLVALPTSLVFLWLLGGTIGSPLKELMGKQLVSELAQYPSQARDLIASAGKARELGKLSEARKMLEDSLRICGSIASELCRADALVALAELEATRGNIDFAFRCYSEALPAYEDADSNIGKAWISLGRGALFAERQPAEAERLYREAIVLFGEDARGLAATRLELGDLLRMSGKYYQAEHELDLAADTYRRLGDDAGLGRTLSSIAYLLGAREHFDRARKLMLQVNELSNGIEGEQFILRSLFYEWVGSSLVRGRIGAAGRERLKQALTYAELSGDTERIASVLTSIARYELKRGELRAATEAAEQAINARDSPLGRANIFLVQSGILEREGDTPLCQ